MPKIERAGDRRRASAGRHGAGSRGAVHGDDNPLSKRSAAAYRPPGPGTAGTSSAAFTEGVSAGKTIGATAGRRSLDMPKMPKPGVV
ncbi:hypothetical protein ACFVGM_08660 [Kitasatospora purpeofusca]|uniref:hypothetical protein n=1 Tax=Kitasatospora purpeofusca TaxID=67352 RepID=UPI0036D17C56